MSTLIMMKGLPKSGKTTWAKKWANKSHKRVYVSWSAILDMMGGKFKKQRQVIAFDAAMRVMKNAIRQGLDVVVDECNLYGAEWGMFVTSAQLMGAKVEWMTIDTPLEVCLQRNKEANYPLLDEQIIRLDEKYRQWLSE